jgi:signal transduction histidine kinase
MMIPHLIISIALMALTLFPSPSTAEDGATPQEVIAKVNEAAAYLAEHGESGLSAFKQADSPFVWRDTYVFVYNCEDGLANVAHPVPATKQVALDEDKDADGNVIGPKFCEAAANPGGSWFEYPWWKPVKAKAGEELKYASKTSRKVTYMLDVEGQPYQVGAGVYEDTLSVKKLNEMVEK